jgi:NADH:ubiquinone oxidoreductase subunit C
MSTLSSLQAYLPNLLGNALLSQRVDLGELTLEVENASIKDVLEKLRDDQQCQFDQLIDLCGMDYSEYGSEDGGPSNTHESGSRNANTDRNNTQGGSQNDQENQNEIIFVFSFLFLFFFFFFPERVGTTYQRYFPRGKH